MRLSEMIVAIDSLKWDIETFKKLKDEPEDDGQPSEYDEWQDYMGGDEYYDHSENACW